MSFIMILFFYMNIIQFQNCHLFAKNDMTKYHTFRKLNNIYEPIRIVIDERCLYESLKRTLRPDQFQLLNYSIYQAKESLENLINVTRLQNKIHFLKTDLDNNLQDCINENYLNNGVQADLLIFIRSKLPGETSSNYPIIIKYENNDNRNRPIIGTIVYEYEPLSDESDEFNKQKFSVFFLHLFTHILGFKKQLLINKGLLNQTLVADRIHNGSQISKYIIKGPNVLNWAIKYYNCSSLQGIEVDDTVTTEGEEYIHWSPRLLLGDYMTAQTYYPDQYISEFTLALLEDLGWYRANYLTGGLMKFGKNKGCDFLEKDCVYPVPTATGNIQEVFSSFSNEFCNYKRIFDYLSTIGTCSSGRQSMGYCYGAISSQDVDISIRRNYQSRYGFGKTFYEACPITYEVNNDPDNLKKGYYYGNCKFGYGKYGVFLSVLNNINSNYRYYNVSNVLKEEYSDISFCALSSILKKGETILQGIIRPSCYQMFCSDESLTIRIDEEYIVCPKQGGLIKVEGPFTKYDGFLYCPDYYLICSVAGTEICNNIFDCIDKKITFNESAYNQSSNKNISISLLTDLANEITESPVEGHELSRNGQCPQYCRQCISNHQCIICSDPYNKYVGTKENDSNPIFCYEEQPGDGYYITTTYISGKTYYFTCIENCVKCTKGREDKCDQCAPTHFINKDTICEERIPGCKDYDNSSLFNDPSNNNGPAYKTCYNCDNLAGFYCVDNITTQCVNLTDYTNETYYNMQNKDYPCVQKCEKKYSDCEKCNNVTCTKCKYDNTFVNHYHNCVKNITHCQEHNMYNNTSECLACQDGYYCLRGDTINCVTIDNIDLYYPYDYTNNNIRCYEECKNTFSNCQNCNKDNCIKCFEGYYINNNNHCLEKIDNCKNYNLEVEYQQCTECNNNYYCIRNNTLSCEIIDDIKYYYYYNYTEKNIQCIERCNNTFSHCVECTKTGCTKCEYDYFVYNGECIKNITGCIDNIYDGTKKECNECNNKESYYCLNNTRTECYHVDIRNYTPYYYLSTENNFPCYITCDHILDNCLTCDNTQCIECNARNVINDAHTQCLPRPFIVPDNDNCTIKILETNKNIFEIDPWDLIDVYWNNIPYISTVDHYVGNNFTATIFVHSECTEGLFDEGYFKINSSELQNTMIKESHTDGMKVLFSVFINYNYKSHLRYYNINNWYLDPYKLCSTCLDVDYTITKNFYDNLNDTFGKAILSLVYSENLDFLDKDSEIFNDICENVTLYRIDIPLKKRLYYLHMHKYRDKVLCNSDNCTVEEYNYENSTVVCKCRMGNKYEDVINSEKFEYQPYDDKEDGLKQSNEFVESLSTIKCSVNGFKLKNFRSNIGLFICIGFIAIQIGLFVFYCVGSKPVVNVNKSISMSSPPKKTQLKFITDWDRSVGSDKIGDEDEIFVQPRDDADDQLLEEERSYADNMIDLSGLSIETNFGGAIKNISTGNKLDEKADQKRVLILLSNRGKNKSKNLAEDMKSDSDIIPQIQDENNPDNNISYGKIYWHVLSLKQHIINFFSFIDCCKITESYIPLSIRLIRSLFMIILSLVLNIIFLNQTYYDNKFDYFNKEYIIINSETDDINIPSGKRLTYAVKNTFGKAVISFIILLAVQFIFGIVFFSVRKSIIKAKMKKSHKVIQEIIAKSKKKNIAFYIIVMVCMILFFFTISGFIGIYGGGVVDYLTAGIISLILLEIFPFIWSLIIALFTYLGMKNNNKCCYKFSGFFMF